MWLPGQKLVQPLIGLSATRLMNAYYMHANHTTTIIIIIIATRVMNA
jgi:hypothetical protein